MRRLNLPALTGLRAAAALFIIAYHFAQYFPAIWNNRAAHYIISFAALAMPVFFVLSGLFLTVMFSAVAASSPPEGRERIEKRRFYFGRFARLYPTYLFAALLFAPPALYRVMELAPPGHATGTVVKHVLVQLFLLQSWAGQQYAFIWNAPVWTLSVDVAIYAIFPFVAPWMWSRVKDARSAAMWFAIFSAAAWIAPAAWLYFQPDGPHPVTAGRLQAPYLTYLKCSLIGWWPCFAIGLVIGKAFLLGIGREYAGRFILLGSAIAAVMLALPGVPPMMLHMGLLLPASALLTLGVAYEARGTGFLGRGVFFWLGEASLAIYLLHVEAYVQLHKIMVRFGLLGPNEHRGWFFAFAVVAVLISARVVHRFIELPVRALLLARYPKRPEESLPSQHDDAALAGLRRLP